MTALERVLEELRQYDIDEISEISGVPASDMYFWLVGEHEPRLCNLISVAEALNLKVEVTIK